MRRSYLLLALFAPLLCWRCEQWIEIKPENSITFENAFDTEKDIESAILSTESSIRAKMTGGTWVPQQRGEYSDYRDKYSIDLLYEPKMANYIASWANQYGIIASANVVLPYIDQIDMPQERRDFYRGSALFFKAFAYLDILRRWGDCVLIREEVEIAPIAKTRWPEVADYAIDLAQEAVRLLPEWDQLTDALGNPVTHKARPCKGAANAVLAHLCAWKAGCKYIAVPEDRNYDEQALWKMAEEACSAIIGRPDIYDLEATPEEVCTKTFVDGGKECVFESVIRGYWNELDASFSSSNNFNLGRLYQAYPSVSKKTEADIKQTTYRFKSSTVHNMFEYGPGPQKRIDLRRDAWFHEVDNMDTLPISITGGFAYPNKWRQSRVATEGWQAGTFLNFDQNKIWWRLADIYLLRAECYARQNKTDEAISDLNKIRNRAHAPAYQTSEYGGDLLYAIFKEREKELLMEGCRYFDVLRYGYYREMLYGNFCHVSEQDIVDGVFFNALPKAIFKDNPLMRQNTYWLNRE